MQGQQKYIDETLEPKLLSAAQEIETRSLQIGQQIFDRSHSSAKNIFNRNFWQAKMMDLATADPKVKTQLFRFVDVLPVLKTAAQKRAHLIEYLSKPSDVKKWPKLLSLTAFLLRLPVVSALLVFIAQRQVEQMARLFIVGQNARDVLPKLKELRRNKTGFTLDILGEAVLSEIEAHHYRSQYLSLLESLGEEARTWSSVDVLDHSPKGVIPKVNVSIKISALDPQSDPTAFETTLERLEERILPILRLAKEKNIFINFDMEQFSLRELVMELFRRILFRDEFREYPHLGIVVQAYLKSARQDVRFWVEQAKLRKTAFTIRLVKGAYWDYESIIADHNSWESPVFDEKWKTDLAFEECAGQLLSAFPDIELAVGSHNVRSIAYTASLAESLKLPKNAFEIQMLYGMSGAFKEALIGLGFRVREYCPMGEMIPGLSYLVRRLLENTANDSFLKQSLMDHAQMGELLQSPKKKGSKK
jgi:RHH-type proline utilization regulon transcriptional repressor/proline dehydrogenase/delta 1-pyrroline-5-carboxylate dehydrogenase